MAKRRRAQAHQRFHRVAVTAPKGGVGKTFVAAHLAWDIHDWEGHSVGVVDLGSLQNAAQWIDDVGYNDAANMCKDNFVFQARDGIVVASCRDWDKEDATASEFKHVIETPRLAVPALAHGALLSKANVLVYDSDHWLRSFVHFLRHFESVVILVDPSDPLSLRNLAESWPVVANMLGVVSATTTIRIVANRTTNPIRAESALVAACTKTLRMKRMDERAIKGICDHMRSLFLTNVSVPFIPQAASAFARSTPVWKIAPKYEAVFDAIAAEIGAI